MSPVFFQVMPLLVYQLACWPAQVRLETGLIVAVETAMNYLTPIYPLWDGGMDVRGHAAELNPLWPEHRPHSEEVLCETKKKESELLAMNLCPDRSMVVRYNDIQ